MPIFAYNIVDAQGQMRGGTITAETPATARQLLRDSGWRIQAINPLVNRETSRRSDDRYASIRALRLSVSTLSGSRRQDQVAEFARQLALLLRSGVALAEAIDVLIEQHQGRPFQVVLRDLDEQVQRGSNLADALRRHPRWFGRVFVSAVQTGQSAGTLEHALVQLSSYLQDQEQLRRKVTAALIYPVILGIVGLCVSLFLMTYVVPQLATILTANDRPLPFPTAVLLTVSSVLRTYWVWIVAGTVIAAIAAGRAARSTWGRRFIDSAMIRIPLLGGVVRRALVARFAQQMNMLLQSGIRFTEAIAIVSAECAHTILKDELNAVQRAVMAGKDIAPTLAESRVFPPLVVHLVAVGQHAGELPDMLAELRVGYEAEINHTLAKFTAALEPLLIIVLSGVVGFIVLATVLPILEATEVMR